MHVWFVSKRFAEKHRRWLPYRPGPWIWNLAWVSSEGGRREDMVDVAQGVNAHCWHVPARSKKIPQKVICLHFKIHFLQCFFYCTCDIWHLCVIHSYFHTCSYISCKGFVVHAGVAPGCPLSIRRSNCSICRIRHFFHQATHSQVLTRPDHETISHHPPLPPHN